MAIGRLPSGVRIVDANGLPTPEFQRNWNSLFERVGGGAERPPSTPTGLAYSFEAGGVRLVCNENPAAEHITGYQWRIGATWADPAGKVLSPLGSNSILVAIVAADIGTYTAWVAAANARGDFSTPASIPVTITAADMGISGPVVNLSAPRQAFINLKNGGGLTPATITLTATVFNLPAPVYAWHVDGVLQVGEVSSTFALPAFTGNAKAVRCDVTSGALTAYDIFSIYSLNEGDDSIQAGLTNEDQSISVDAGGTPTAGLPATGTMLVARGAVILATPDVSFALASSSGCTASINATTGAYSVTAISADAASATFRATVTATGATLDSVMTLHKAYPGATGSTGARGTRQLYDTNVLYTATYNNGAGAGAPSYKAQSTTLIAAAVSGSTPTTPIKGDTVTFTNGVDYITTYTNNGTFGTNGNNSWALPGTVIDGSLLVTGSVTAAKLSVINLAAISADLGSITAGTITGATIRTAASGARVELSGSTLKATDSGGNKLVEIDNTGKAAFTGGVYDPTGGTNYAAAVARVATATNPTAIVGFYGTSEATGFGGGQGVKGHSLSTNPNGSGVYGLAENVSSIGVLATNNAAGTALDVIGKMQWGPYTWTQPAGGTTKFLRQDGNWGDLTSNIVLVSSGNATAGAALGYLVIDTYGAAGQVKIAYNAL